MQKTPVQSPFAAFLLLAVVMLTVNGCGFQPRGHSSAAADIPSPLVIRGAAEFSGLYRELSRQLQIAGVELSPPGTPGLPVLQISGVKSESRLLSVNSRNKAVEFELIELASFNLRSAAGKPLVPQQELKVIRIQYRPEVAVLGSNREAELLRRDMREELASRIIQRLTTQHAAAR